LGHSAARYISITAIVWKNFIDKEAPMKRALIILLALSLLLPLAACRKEVPAPVEAFDTEGLLAAAEAAQTPQEAQQLLARIVENADFPGVMPDEALLALEKCVFRAAREFTREHGANNPEDPALPLYELEDGPDSDGRRLYPRYAFLEEALHGRVTEDGAAYLLAQRSEQEDYGKPRCFVRKAAFEQGWPALLARVDRPDDGISYADSKHHLFLFLSRYHYGEEGEPIMPFKRADLESFLDGEANRDCVHYAAVQSVFDLYAANGWIFDEALKESVAGILDTLTDGTWR